MNHKFYIISEILKLAEDCALLDGGKSAGLTVNDIANKHNVPVEDILKQLAMGMEVEKEHIDDIDARAKIARDHLTEDPLYYTKLKKMESS